MLRQMLAASLLVGLVSPSFASDAKTTSTTLSAVEIVNRNAAARGGLDAWRKVLSLSESGQMGAGGDRREPVSTPTVTPPPGAKKVQPLPSSPRLAKEAQLPFLLELERPRKLRLELQFNGKTAIQVYDGTNGWMVRPYLNRMEVESYTPEELKMAAMQSDLDGPLMDYQAKGSRVELAGTEKLDDRLNYKLAVTTRSGEVIHVWIDAETYLETKIEGQPRKLDGKMHPVEIYYKDYRKVEGLQIPFLLVTKVLPIENAGTHQKTANVPVEQIVIDKVVVNPKLDSSSFAKPEIKAGTVSRQGL